MPTTDMITATIADMLVSGEESMQAQRADLAAQKKRLEQEQRAIEEEEWCELLTAVRNDFGKDIANHAFRPDADDDFIRGGDNLVVIRVPGCSPIYVNYGKTWDDAKLVQFAGRDESPIGIWTYSVELCDDTYEVCGHRICEIDGIIINTMPLALAAAQEAERHKPAVEAEAAKKNAECAARRTKLDKKTSADEQFIESLRQFVCRHAPQQMEE